MSEDEEWDLIYRAIQKEQAENPFCPVVADLLGPLLERAAQGDKGAWDMAVEIAQDSLAPRRSIWDFFRRR